MRWGLVLAITLSASQAAAHVSPSVDDNNRFLKVTPQGDRVRLAYTVFYGENPGAVLRRTLDTNRDGTIGDSEAQAFATKVAAEVAAALDVTLDDKARPIRWTTVAVGMGSSKVAAGSFSIDLVTYLCLPTARGRHELRVFDRLKLDRPGEFEVKVEDGLGITLHRARIGALSDPSHEYKFAGPGGPMADDGLDVSYTASDKAPVNPDATCSPTATKRIPMYLIVIAGAVVGVALAAAAALVVRRRRRR